MSRRLVSAAVVAALVAFPAGAAAETITVNDAADVVANDGNCVLREAIEAANNNTASGAMADECDAGEVEPEVDLIDFDLGADGTSHTISLVGSDLPVVTEAVEIDGRNGTAMAPRIEIDGSAAGAGGTGLFITTGSDGSYIHDLAVNGFTSDGINLFSGSNTVERVLSGTNLAGTSSTVGNDGDGIQISGDGNLLNQVVASANAGNGISVEAAADGTTISGSRIGTSKDGTTDLGNTLTGIRAVTNSLGGQDGLVIGTAQGLTPGGGCTGDCNVISGNGLHGVELLAAALPITAVTVRGNHIGTNNAGSGDLGNDGDGVVLQADVRNTAIDDNVVSGNGDEGIVLTASSSATVTAGPSNTAITGNRIGTSSAGTAALANADRGIQLVSDVTSSFDPIAGTVIGGSSDLTPGGACTGDCNLISGNGTFGISLFGATDGTDVLGNHIGTNLAGSAALANGQAGLNVTDTESIQIGQAGAGNVISGNTFDGITVDGVAGTPTAVAIQANVIGAQSDGSGAVPNGDDGVTLFTDTSEALIGGTGAGEGNVIAHNADTGVDSAGGVAPALDNAILGNSIHSNASIGIDHGDTLGGDDGVTPNDGLGDADDGGNGLQNFPELTAAVAGGSTTVVGRLESTASTTFRIEVFGNSAADGSGFGEGETYLGAFTVATDGAGLAEFRETVTGSAGAGESISATATELDDQGDPLATSEFSADIAEGCTNVPTSGPDTVIGTAATEVLCGLGGDDVIRPGGGDDIIIGGAGSDELDLSAAGGAGADLEAGTASAGSDELSVAEIENLRGGPAADTLSGDAGANELRGGGGDDTLTGAAGDDLLSGQGGKDELIGGNDEDELLGGEGADTLKGQAAVDSIQGQDGTDELLGGTGGDEITGGANADEIQGQDGGDDLKGQDADDEITGGANADHLEGGDGDDDLKGQAAKDSLNGGSGSKDVCDGGDDNDDASAPGCETKTSIP